MLLTFDDALKFLVESGKKAGFLTFTQVNDSLPDTVNEPERTALAQGAARYRRAAGAVAAGGRGDDRGCVRGFQLQPLCLFLR